MNEALNPFIIKLANENDMIKILPLLEQLGHPQDTDNFKKRYLEFVAAPGYGVAIAQQEDTLIGMIAWSKALLLVSNSVRVRVEGLIVDQKHRGQRVGEQLMNFFENFSKQFSPCIIEVTSGARHVKDGADKFYYKLGYKNAGQMEKLYLRKYL